MSRYSVNSRCPTCNHSSLSSDTTLYLSDRIDQLDLASVLLTRAGAMTAIASGNALHNCTDSQRHHYLAILDELIHGGSL